MAGDGWSCRTFQELIDCGVLEIGDGYRAKNEELGGHGPIFLRAGHVENTHISFDGVERFQSHLSDRVKPKLALTGDTIVTTKGNSTGRTSFVTSEMPLFVYSPHLSYWRSLDHRQLVPGFLRYWARCKEFAGQLDAMKVSTDMAPYLSLTDQRRLRITIPPPKQQHAIAHILGTLDDKIELNRRMNETLEAIAGAIFKSWFVDFDPVRAKISGRQPEGMDPATAALFPNRFQNSALGPIPKGWRTGALGTQIEPVRGLSYNGSGLANTGVPMHNLNSVYEGGGYKYEGIKYYTGEYDERYLVSPGDVIVTNTEQGHERLLIGYAAIVPECFGPQGLFSHHLYRVRPRKESPLRSHYLAYLFNSWKMHETVSAYGNGTTVNMLPKAALDLPLVTLPPPKLVERFDSLASGMLARQEQSIQQNRLLTATRDQLLPRLLSGQVRVR